MPCLQSSIIHISYEKGEVIPIRKKKRITFVFPISTGQITSISPMRYSETLEIKQDICINAVPINHVILQNPNTIKVAKNIFCVNHFGKKFYGKIYTKALEILYTE